MNRDEQIGRMILEASTGMHGDIARDLAQAWCNLAEKKQALQSRLESLEKDAARWKWFAENGENQDHDDIVRYLNSYVVTKQYLDHRIDTAMQANKGE